MGDVQILEQGKPLSECLLWPLIETFYAESGPEAWSQTPYYPTNNAFLGDAYAELIAAFLRDSAAQINPDEPVYLLELAAGLGVLSRFVLASLPEKLAAFEATKNLKIRYVLTDFTESNLNFWEKEEALKTSEIDFALFKPEQENQLTLRRSETTLAPGTLKNPLVVLANYFFDSIRHDYFWTEHGKLFEIRPLICKLSDQPTSLATLSLNAQKFPMSQPHYPDARWNALLDEYAQCLPEGSFLLPIGALRVLENLKQLSGGRCLLLSADKGIQSLASMEGHREIPYTPHTGSCSFMVNFDALRRFVEGDGGQAWHGPSYPTLEGFAAVLSGGDWESLAYAAPVQLAALSDRYGLTQRLAATLSQAEPQEAFRVALASVRLASGDPWVFQACGAALLLGATSGVLEQKEALLSILPLVEARLAPTVVGAFAAYGWLRCLLFHLEDHTSCLSVSAECMRFFGPHRDGYFYPAAIAERQGQTASALQFFRLASEADPTCPLSKEAVIRLSLLQKAA
jgi:hypothetical protein